MTNAIRRPPSRVHFSSLAMMTAAAVIAISAATAGRQSQPATSEQPKPQGGLVEQVAAMQLEFAALRRDVTELAAAVESQLDVTMIETEWSATRGEKSEPKVIGIARAGATQFVMMSMRADRGGIVGTFIYLVQLEGENKPKRVARLTELSMTGKDNFSGWKVPMFPTINDFSVNDQGELILSVYPHGHGWITTICANK